MSAQSVIGTPHILLATATVKIRDINNAWQSGSALLDGGSQSNFISKEFANRLGYKPKEISHVVSGIGQQKSNISQKLFLKIYSSSESFNKELEFLIFHKVTCDLPTAPINKDQLNLPALTLADEQFHQPSPVELLIGAQAFYELLLNEQIKVGKGKPILHKTTLGWKIAGPISTRLEHSVVTHSIQTSLQESIEQFWAIEDIPKKAHLSREEKECENHFKENYLRDATGRFVVKLPFKKKSDVLGDSKETAAKRLYAIENKMRKDIHLKTQYCTFMKDYEKLGHMRKIDKNLSHGTVKNYLPHHSVFKQTMEAPKIRVVFDASATTSTGSSLNAVLMVDPTIQQTLFSIILRFRQHKFVIIGDIVKMYRQVLVNESDRKYQCILWRDSPDKAIHTYQFNTVTYGTSSASFLAVRCLHQLAYENSNLHRKASQVILEDFYMDDVLTGSQTLEELIQLKQDLVTVLNSTGFETNKWISNVPTLSEIETNNQVKQLGHEENIVKTLGVKKI